MTTVPADCPYWLANQRDVLADPDWPGIETGLASQVARKAERGYWLVKLAKRKGYMERNRHLIDTCPIKGCVCRPETG